MGVDLNKMANDLKSKKQVGVNREGGLSNTNPQNDGTKKTPDGFTNTKPKKFFLC